MCIRDRCKVSDTQVTFKACGPLVTLFKDFIYDKFREKKIEYIWVFYKTRKIICDHTFFIKIQIYHSKLCRKRGYWIDGTTRERERERDNGKRPIICSHYNQPLCNDGISWNLVTCKVSCVLRNRFIYLELFTQEKQLYHFVLGYPMYK